jgi:hypothetical protein
MGREIYLKEGTPSFNNSLPLRQEREPEGEVSKIIFRLLIFENIKYYSLK